MPTYEEVSRFLSRFFPKMDIWGILFIDRDKNQKALSELSITADIRLQIIRSLQADDFVETIPSLFAGIGDMWVFGKDYDGNTLYIKIAMGQPNDKTICISFHKAEKPSQYKYK